MIARQRSSSRRSEFQEHRRFYGKYRGLVVDNRRIHARFGLYNHGDSPVFYEGTFYVIPGPGSPGGWGPPEDSPQLFLSGEFSGGMPLEPNKAQWLLLYVDVPSTATVGAQGMLVVQVQKIGDPPVDTMDPVDRVPIRVPFILVDY